MPRRLKNIRPWKGGWQAYTQVGGHTFAKSFPLSASVPEMRAWIAHQRDAHGIVKPLAGSLAADIADYLTRVTALATYSQRVKDMDRWADALGRDRPRRTVTAADIDRVLQDWLLAGSSPSTVRKRRMALLAMWNKLDGKDQLNPVRGSASPQEPKPEARAIDYATIGQALEEMAPRPSRGTKRNAQRQRYQLIARVIAWTGFPPKMLMQVRPEDLNLAGAMIRIRPRRKGKGVEARTLPLIPQAVAAFRDFDAAHAYGPFSGVSLNYHFQAACRRLDPPLAGYCVYDLRHSFLTMLYKVTRDLATVARFGLHANVSMAQRYALGANQDVDRDAADLLGKLLSSIPVPLSNLHHINTLQS